MKPEVFGWQHLLYTAITLAISILAIIFIKKYCKTERAKSIAVYISAGILLVAIIMNRISQGIVKDCLTWSFLLPDTWCSATSYALALCCFIFRNKKSTPFHFIIYLGLLGPGLTAIYPDFIGQNASIFFGPTITGLLHHSIALYLSILLIVLYDFRPTLKKWYALPLGSALFVAYGVLLSNVIGKTNAMLVDGSPLLSGTPFTWYVLGIMLCGLVWIISGVFDLIKIKRDKKLKDSSQ